MPSLTDVFVAILPDTTQFGRQLTSQLRRIDAQSDGKRVGGSFTSGFSGALKGIGIGLAGAFAAAGVGAAIKGTISAASDLGESVNAVNVVFGDAAKGVLALGNNAAKSVGLSKTEFNGLAVRFSNFATTVAGAGGDVTGVLGDLTGRAADFASVMNLDVNEAAQIFQSTLSGESEPIKQFGIDMSAAAVEAYALANGIGTAGKKLTESEKVQARYAMLMEETARTTGDFANTSDSLANRQRILGATFDNIKASIGAGFLPIMEKAFGFVLDFAIPAVTVLVEALRGGEVTTVGFLGRIGDFGNVVRDAFGAVKGAVTVFVEALRGGEVTTVGFLGRIGDFGYIVRDAFGGIKDAVTVFVEALRGGEVTTLGFLGRVGDFGYLVRDAFGGVKDAVIVFVEALRGGEVTTLGFLGRIGDLGYIVRDAFGEVKDGVKGFIEAFRSGGEEITRSGFAGGLQQIGVFARDAFDYIRSDVIPAAMTLGRTLGVMLREVGQGALPIAVAAFKSLFSAMTGVFNFVKANDTVFSSLAAGLVAGYVAFKIFTAVTNAFKVAQVAAMVVTTAYKAVLQAYALWTYTATGSTTAFAFAMHVLKAAFLSNPIGIVVIALVALGAALFVAYKKSETFRDIVNSAWAAIKGSVGGVVDWFQSSVLPVLQGVWDGISSKAVALWHGLQAAWDGIRVGFRAAMSGFMAVYDNVIAPVFGAFKTAAQFLWDGVEKVWVGIRVGFAAAMVGFRAVYDNLIAPVFGAFKTAAGLLWEGVKFFWQAIKTDFALAMAGISIVYDRIIEPVFSAFGAAAQLLWRVLQPVWAGIGAGFALALRGFGAVYDAVVAPVFAAFLAGARALGVGVRVAWDGLRSAFAVAMSGFGAVYNTVVAPVFAAFKAGALLLWNGVQLAWDGIRIGFSAAMTGFRAVYQTLIAPVFVLFRAAAQALWDGVTLVWEGIRAGFDLSMQGIRAVYQGAMVPVFNAYKAAAQVLWRAAEAAWEGIRAAFDLSMKAVRAVYDSVVAPLFKAFRAAAQVLWDGVRAIWDGMRASFDAVSRGIRAVYDGIVVPMFNAYRAAAQSLWTGLQAIWNGMRSSFDAAMRGMRAVYDGIVRPLLGTFESGVDRMRVVFDSVVRSIGASWSTLRDRMRDPIKVAFDWVNSNVIGAMNSVLSKFPGGISVPSLPRLAKGGPVKGPGGPTEDKVLARLSAGEFVVNAAAAKRFRPLLETLNKGTIRDESLVSSFSSVKRTSLSESSSVSRVRDDGSIVVGAGTAKKHRKLLEDINAGRAPTRLPGDEFGGPVGDVWGTITSAAGAIKGFAADMIAKGARKAAELLLNPLKDRLLSMVGSGNVVSAILRGGLEKLFAAVLAKGDEKDKEMAAAKKAGSAGGGISAYPGGGSQANLVAFGRLIQSMGGRASEHPLFGGVHPVHTRNSNHYSGKAIDLNYGPGGQNSTEMAFFDRIRAQGLPGKYGLRSIWRAPGHFNHMHVDYDKGGYLQPGAMGVNRGPRPERILTSAQTESFDRLVRVLEKGQGSDTRPPLVVNAYGAREETLARHVLEGLRRRDALYQMG